MAMTPMGQATLYSCNLSASSVASCVAPTGSAIARTSSTCSRDSQHSDVAFTSKGESCGEVRCDPRAPGVEGGVEGVEGVQYS
eukprot:6202043-Pleurochrysis_carterae.AAC.1